MSGQASSSEHQGPGRKQSREIGYDDVSLVVPVLNEAKTIGVVIGSARKACEGVELIVVVDARTDDGSADVARSAGADVVLTGVPGGHGRAIRAGLLSSSRPIAAMVDGDGTSGNLYIWLYNPDYPFSPQVVPLARRQVVRHGRG